MSTPFTRSIRILEADRFLPSIIVISVAILILAGWLAWLFFAQITLRESGKLITINNTGLVTIEMSPTAAQRVKSGQKGVLDLNGDIGEDLGLVPVIVTRRLPSNGEKTQIEAQVILESFFVYQTDETYAGTGRIDVDQVSPLNLFLRSTGQFLGAPQLTTSSGNTSQNR